MNIRILHVKLLLLIFPTFILYASPLLASCFEPFHASDPSGWDLNISADSYSADLESTDEHLSGPAGTEDWKATNDVDGTLDGFSLSITPPLWGKRITMNFSLLSGDLTGKFNTREISPTPEGPYDGKVDFDRDEWELGADIFILNAVYARLAYSTYEMDGDWVYALPSPNEPQEYEFDAYTIGAGFRQNYFLDEPKTAFGKDIGLLLDVFLGLSFYDYEHTEKLTGASVETSDMGYEIKTELLATYDLDIVGLSYVFAGIDYTYKKNDESSLDLTEKGFTYKLGIRSSF